MSNVNTAGAAIVKPVVNSVIISGALTRDGSLTYTPKGTAIYAFTLAGTLNDKPFFANVKAFGKTAEAMVNLKPGDTVEIKGKVSFNSWKDEDGNAKSKTEVVANSFEQVELETQRLENGGHIAKGGTNSVVLIGNAVRSSRENSLTIAVNNWKSVGYYFVVGNPLPAAVSKGQRIAVKGRWVDEYDKETKVRSSFVSCDGLEIIERTVTTLTQSAAPVEQAAD